jgi:hypothetical protein
MDFSGIIKQVGEGVSPSEFKQGDEVYGQAGVISGDQEHLQRWLSQMQKVSDINQRS